MASKFQLLPSVDRLLSEGRIKQLQESYPRGLVVDLIRQSLGQVRHSIALGEPCPSVDEIAESVYAQAWALSHPSLRPVINATGVILHTNLGRAPLSQEALVAMDSVAKGYCNLEFDLDSGARGSRHSHIEQILCQLT